MVDDGEAEWCVFVMFVILVNELGKLLVEMEMLERLTC